MIDRTGKRTCDIDGCKRNHCARGLCNGHYQRVQKHGDARVALPLGPGRPRLRTGCSVDGCSRTSHARGLCKGHYSRRRRLGTTHPSIPLGRMNGVQDPARRPTREQLFWIAGFFEGEAWFGRGRDHCARVTVNQVQKAPLNTLLDLLGGSLYHHPNPLPRQQDKHQWSAWGSRARGIMMTVYSLMSPRRQWQIRRALAEQER